MGAIIKGHDVDLGRDLAIKELLDSHKDKPDVVQRFIEEAQIGEQLQHPGIVPIYELGQFGDQRPFFSTKLVKGQTLAELLTARRDPAEDRAKYLGIFEQICQTMAYAHSRGVIHRDLKPANIMIGAFGEVQVLDWGLATRHPGEPSKPAGYGLLTILDCADGRELFPPLIPFPDQRDVPKRVPRLYMSQDGARLAVAFGVKDASAEDRLDAISIRDSDIVFSG